MELDGARAREILDAAHAAWSKGDVEGVLAHYADDITYWCNTGGPDGGALTITGKEPFRQFMLSIATVAESVSVTEFFRFEAGVGRAKVECYLRHRQSRHLLVGTYRQIVHYRDGKILRLDEYHDAARMAAFWRLIANEQATPASV